MELTRRRFIQLTGSACVGMAFGGLGFDLRPIDAHAREFKLEHARESLSEHDDLIAALETGDVEVAAGECDLPAMGDSARRWVVGNWSNARLAARHLEIYEELLAKRPG